MKLKINKGHSIQVLDKGFVTYVDHMGDDTRIVEAARVSYNEPSKGPEKDRGLLNYLYRNRHTSPFEMGKILFHIKLPIFVMRQFVRHRMQNLNEVSARYTELPDEFYIPDAWRRPDDKNRQASNPDVDFNPKIGYTDMAGTEHAMSASEALETCCRGAYEMYQTFIRAGVAREMARMILPVNIYTQVYTCWDLNNLIRFITLRDDSHASWEIQQYAKVMKEIARELFPWTIGAFDQYKWSLVDNDPKIPAKG